MGVQRWQSAQVVCEGHGARATEQGRPLTKAFMQRLRVKWSRSRRNDDLAVDDREHAKALDNLHRVKALSVSAVRAVEESPRPLSAQERCGTAGGWQRLRAADGRRTSECGAPRSDHLQRLRPWLKAFSS